MNQLQQPQAPQQQQQYSHNVTSGPINDTTTINDSSTTKESEPKPAVFIAKKLFSDYVRLANKKIEAILTQDTKDKPIFKSLLKNEDIIYDQLLEALGAISEFCLPTLLKASIAWYHHELGVDNEQQKKPAISDGQQQQSSTGDHLQPTASSTDCGSPCLNDTHSSLLLLRSPTPSSPEASNCNNHNHHHHHHHHNQVSITSTLPLDYQSPSSTTVIGELHSSAANTSTSTATNISSNNCSLTEDTPSNNLKRSQLAKTRNLLIEYTFCQLSIELFNQLYLHPGHEDLIGQIEEIAFEHFKHIEASDTQFSASDLVNINQLAEKYAEVIGVLAQTRFRLVRKRFISELNELRAKEPTPYNIQCIVSLLSGLKFFRVKMAPIEDFEASFQFLQECADYFLEVRHKSIKHALAGLFVEIMTPLALTVKNEVRIPCLKNFVETLWAQTLDMCSRKKHSITIFPLVTCLLCVSQRSTFISNWPTFLNMCLSNLKNRDQKVCRVAFESLYRLIWIYMIRIKCESNTVTQARLQSIVDALFPRGSRAVVPRDAPLAAFVDIVQFIAQERLDFAMRHIIFDLLSVDRPFKVITSPERMNIALEAFLLTVDGLQSKDNGELLMPRALMFPENDKNSSNDHNGFRSESRPTRVGAKMLSDDLAKSISIFPYYPHVQRSFNDIIKALDTQFGRPYLLTANHKDTKDDPVITNENKPKIELFKTCLTAIPRLMPEGMSKCDLIDLLARMTIHIDEKMREYAFDSLSILVTDFTDWRLDVIEGYVSFLANQIDNSKDSMRPLADNCFKILLKLLISWHSAITLPACVDSSTSGSSCANGPQVRAIGGDFGGSTTSQRSTINSTMISIQTGYETISTRSGGTGGQIAARKNRALAEMRLIQSELSNIRFDRLVSVIQRVEGAALVMLCNCNQPTRRLANQLLRECRSILKCYTSWTCMEQMSFKTPASAAAAAAAANAAVSAVEAAAGDEVSSNCCGDDDEDLSASLRGSLSADNLSRITATSTNGPLYNSVTSMQNIQTSASVSGLCTSGQQATGAKTIGGSNKNNSNNESGNNNNNNNNNNDIDSIQKRADIIYDSDIENDLLECFLLETNQSKSSIQQEQEEPQRNSHQLSSPASSSSIFWMAVIMLESEYEQEYSFALRLLRKFLPILPLEQAKFTDEVNRNLTEMGWHQFPGIHELVRRGCCSSQNYDLAIELLDQMTPRLKHPLCNQTKPADDLFPVHVIVLLTQLLTNYDDPSPFSLSIARRLAIWCDEEAQPRGKLENLSTVMNLYSRRCFSKNAFQWTKCVVKYLCDAYPNILHTTIPQLVDILEDGPEKVQRLIAPIIYCVLSYTDVSLASQLNADMGRIYAKHLGASNWREAVQIFKLIISRSSHLATSSSSSCSSFSRGELPGRIMDFDLDVESIVLQPEGGA